MNKKRKTQVDTISQYYRSLFTQPSQLTQALAQEEYHREQLLWWKKRRQWLEGQIPTEQNPFVEFIKGLDDGDSNLL